MVDFATSSLELIPRPVKTYHSQSYDRISPSNIAFDAKNKTVLVTAGATGIGFSISRSFAEAGVGRIIIVSRRPEPQARAKADLESQFPKTKVETIPSSVTDRAKMKQILQGAGHVDVLVLCAAASNKHAPLLRTETEFVEQMFETNVTACFDLVKAYLSLPSPPVSPTSSHRTRTVINVSSGSAHCYVPQQTVMAASKAAFAEMLSFFAGEFTPEKDGVRLFSIHPGIFYTPNVEMSYPKDGFAWEDIKLPGDFCVWLASSEADFLHGRFVWAHWDVDEMISQVKDKTEKDPLYLKIGLMQ